MFCAEWRAAAAIGIAFTYGFEADFQVAQIGFHLEVGLETIGKAVPALQAA